MSFAKEFTELMDKYKVRIDVYARGSSTHVILAPSGPDYFSHAVTLVLDAEAENCELVTDVLTAS